MNSNKELEKGHMPFLPAPVLEVDSLLVRSEDNFRCLLHSVSVFLDLHLNKLFFPFNRLMWFDHNTTICRILSKVVYWQPLGCDDERKPSG